MIKSFLLGLASTLLVPDFWLPTLRSLHKVERLNVISQGKEQSAYAMTNRGLAVQCYYLTKADPSWLYHLVDPHAALIKQSHDTAQVWLSLT